MPGGRVFGSSGEVRSLANVTKLSMEAVEDSNGKGRALLSAIEGSESDAVFQQAKEIVDYVARAVSLGQEPLESVISSLNAYADLLESHGK